jgi:uncharacterized membrane protein
MSWLFIGHLALRLLCIAFAVTLGLYAIRRARRRSDAALAALERRFAAGELDAAEFKRVRSILER